MKRLHCSFENVDNLIVISVNGYAVHILFILLNMPEAAAE